MYVVELAIQSYIFYHSDGYLQLVIFQQFYFLNIKILFFTYLFYYINNNKYYDFTVIIYFFKIIMFHTEFISVYELPL